MTFFLIRINFILEICIEEKKFKNVAHNFNYMFLLCTTTVFANINIITIE